MDTPETKHTNNPVDFGEEASAFTTELLEDSCVYLEPEEGEKMIRDRYERMLASATIAIYDQQLRLEFDGLA